MIWEAVVSTSWCRFGWWWRKKKEVEILKNDDRQEMFTVTWTHTCRVFMNLTFHEDTCILYSISIAQRPEEIFETEKKWKMLWTKKNESEAELGGHRYTPWSCPCPCYGFPKRSCPWPRIIVHHGLWSWTVHDHATFFRFFISVNFDLKVINTLRKNEDDLKKIWSPAEGLHHNLKIKIFSLIKTINQYFRSDLLLANFTIITIDEWLFWLE